MVCLHCRTETEQLPTAMPGYCQGCTDHWEEIAKIFLEVTVKEARSVLAGKLPGRVRKKLHEAVKFYDET